MVCVLVYPEVCLVSIVQMINEGRGLCRFNSVTRLKKTPFKFSHKSNSLDFLAPPFVSRQKVENKNITNVRLSKNGLILLS